MYTTVQKVADTVDNVGLQSASDLDRELLILKLVGKGWDNDVPKAIKDKASDDTERAAYFNTLLKDFVNGSSSGDTVKEKTPKGDGKTHK